jgi:effector-binding domain-containing protein
VVVTPPQLDIVDGPRLEAREEAPTIGIRERVPFRTMLSNRDRLLAELIAWLDDNGVEPLGPFFLRLHVVDMAGEMDVEVGVVANSTTVDDRVRASVLPAGNYANLAYRRKSMTANKLLHAWVREQGLVLDTSPHPDGEAFACRCETYLTDPRTEPRKSAWVVELAFLTRN